MHPAVRFRVSSRNLRPHKAIKIPSDISDIVGASALIETELRFSAGAVVLIEHIGLRPERRCTGQWSGPGEWIWNHSRGRG